MASAAAAGGVVDLRLLTFLSHPVLSLCRADEGLHQGAERAAVQQCGGASERTEVRMDVCVSVAEKDMTRRMRISTYLSLSPSSSGIRHGI